VQGILVKSAVKSFIKSYINAGGQDTELLNQKNNKISLERVNAWIIDQYPFKKLFTLQKIYKNRIDKARERIILITPYFMPNR
jgi:phosphatidylserine/phosphatidylglycerophosphate/cardiolipin synthase-like enzyme